MLIRAGSTVLVPRSAKLEADVASHVADNAQLSLAPEIVTRRAVIKAGKQDSVASIARKYKLTPAQVADWNKVGLQASFKAGQSIVVFLPVKAAAPAKRPGSVPSKRAGPSRTGKPAAKRK